MPKDSKRNPRSRRVAAAFAMIAVCGGVAILVVEETMLLAAEPTPRDCISAPNFNVRRPPPPALVPAGIRGFVTSPRLATFNAGAKPNMFAFTFSGRVNAPPDRWRIEVDVLSTPDANPKDEAKWANKVQTFRATGGGPDVFTFSMDGIRPFASQPDAWTPGGLGRLRLVAVLDADPRLCAFLPALDSDGAPRRSEARRAFGQGQREEHARGRRQHR